MLSAANLIPIKLAKKYGIKKIIVHSHNSNVPKNIIKLLLHQINKNQINKYANTLIACSKKAGDWMFGKNDYTILNNAIDVEKFSYNIEYSKERPQELKEKKIIGHVGRFCDTKNQEFIIDILTLLNKSSNNYYLYLIGDGEDKEKIKKKIEKYNLNEQVKIINGTKDVYKYYSQFDLFILPSKFEGLPIVGIEAQANGLPCLFSDRITTELKINNNVKFIKIDNADEWAKEIKHIDNRTNEIKLASSGYDINHNYKKLEEIISRK